MTIIKPPITFFICLNCIASFSQTKSDFLETLRGKVKEKC